VFILIFFTTAHLSTFLLLPFEYLPTGLQRNYTHFLAQRSKIKIQALCLWVKAKKQVE
jgi:hypothetical protein